VLKLIELLKSSDLAEEKVLMKYFMWI
jgi:hypothetical protein